MKTTLSATEKMKLLANILESKLKKSAQQVNEVDSTAVTLAVRPTVNNILIKYTANLQESIQKASDAVFQNGRELSGNLLINSFVTNASVSGNTWKVDPSKTGFVVTGSLLTDPATSATVKKLIQTMNALAVNNLNTEFNRLAKNWSGSSIRNHQTNVNEVNIQL